MCVSALSLECFGYFGCKCDICEKYHKEGYKCPVPVIAGNDKSQIFDVYDRDEDSVIEAIMRKLECRYTRYGNPTWTCVPLEILSKDEFAEFLRKSLLENLDEADKGLFAEELGQYLKKLHAENHAERFSFVLRQFRSAVDSVQRELARLADDGKEKIIKQNAEICFRFSLRSLYLSACMREHDETGLPKALEQESPLRAALVDFIKYRNYIGCYIGCMEECCSIEVEREKLSNLLLGLYMNICPGVVPLTEFGVLEGLDLAYSTRINGNPPEWISIFGKVFVKEAPWMSGEESLDDDSSLSACYSAAFDILCCHVFTYTNEAIAMAISEVRTEIEKDRLKSLFDVLVYREADCFHRLTRKPKFVPPLYDKRSDRVGEKFAMIMNIVDWYFKLFESLNSSSLSRYGDVIGLIARKEIGEWFCKGDYDNHGRSLMYSNYRGIGGKKYSLIGDLYDNWL